MRESVLSNLASQAATDPDFLRRVRQDSVGPSPGTVTTSPARSCGWSKNSDGRPLG